jgi:hypothetical protein
VSPVIPTTKYVNIGELPLKGFIELFVVKNINIPGVTVPDTDVFIFVALNIIVFPDVICELSTIKLGFIVYADEVCKINVLPVVALKKPLGAAELYMLSTNEESKTIP